MIIQNIKVYFLLFIIYSFLGWSMEVIGKLFQYKRFINRGFLIGPYCPIYGVGAILITVLLNRFTFNPILLFIMAILVCGTLEYLTSYFMEKIFHARWWDYSQRRFNINGRVCSNTLIPFGLLGTFIMYVSNPFFINKIHLLNDVQLSFITYVIGIIYIFDNIISFTVISYVGKTTKIVGYELDNTEEITKKVKEVLLEKSVLHRRLVNAYPKIQAIKIKLKSEKERIRKQVKEQKDIIKQTVEKQKEDIKDKIETFKQDKK